MPDAVFWFPIGSGLEPHPTPPAMVTELITQPHGRAAPPCLIALKCFLLTPPEPQVLTPYDRFCHQETQTKTMLEQSGGAEEAFGGWCWYLAWSAPGAL